MRFTARLLALPLVFSCALVLSGCEDEDPNRYRTSSPYDPYSQPYDGCDIRLGSVEEVAGLLQSETPEVCVGQALTVEGKILFTQAFDNSGRESRGMMLAAADGKRFGLRFVSGRAPLVAHGTQVRLFANEDLCGSGELLVGRTEIFEARATVSAAGGVTAAPPAGASGPQNVLAILVSFSDLPTTYSHADVNRVLFSESADYLNEISFNKVTVNGAVTGPYNVGLSSHDCQPWTIADRAQNAAVAAGVNVAAYDRIMYIFDEMDCSWAGLGTIEGNPSESWINGYLNLRVVSHELGHNLGVVHSHALYCGTAILGGNCSNNEYGDVTDVMGYSDSGHFTAFQKEALGWLETGAAATGPRIQTVSASGDYVLAPYSRNSADVKALKISRGTRSDGLASFYYVEYRQPIGSDECLDDRAGSNLTRGVIVHTGAPDDIDSSYLLNMNARSNPTRYAAALDTGWVYDDWKSGVKLELISTDGTQAMVRVTVNSGSQPPAECR